LRTASGAAAVLAVCLLDAARPATASTLLIRGGRVIDGTGAAARRADVRLEGDHIASVAPDLAPLSGERVIDARGKVVAPGFIDLHNHSDRQVFQMPEAATQTAQGITTLLVGVDGGGTLPVRDFLDRLEAAHAAVNIGTMVGHGAVRSKVMGQDFKRPARPAEVAAMSELVAQGMADGAFGLSSGLEYDPGFYSTTDELVALAEAAARRGGFYASHIRNEADETLRALAEAVEIGWRARIPVHISHIKLGTVGVWGRAAEALAILHQAARENDVTADWYPYDFWASTTYVLTPGRDWEDRQSWVKGLADVGGAGHVLITDFPADHSYDGKTLAGVAAARRQDPADVLMDIVHRGNADILCTSMSDQDLAAFLRDPLVMVASDGGIQIAHPRGAGTFPRVLGRYVRERGEIPLEVAVRKMTGMPARRLGLTDRGLLRPGMKADVVVFDPRTVLDRSTAERPQARPAGIEHVFVNGVAVVEAGRPTAARPGRILRSLPRDVGHEQSLDRPSLDQMAGADLVQVRDIDAGVPDVVGIHGHRDAAAAVLETARAAHDHAAREPALLDHPLQGIEDFLRALLPARSLGVARRPGVEADEDVALGLGHPGDSKRRSPAMSVGAVAEDR
jgi:N-acyl-D-amino-acid deacylase